MKPIPLFSAGLLFISVISFAQAPTNYAQVCTEIGDAAQAQLTSTLSQVTKTGSALEIYQHVAAHADPGFTPWVLGMSLRPNARKAAYAFQMVRASMYAFSGIHPGIEPPPSPTPNPSPTPIQRLPETPELENYLQYFSENNPTYSPETIQRVNIVHHYSQDGRYDQLVKDAPVICLKYLSPGCGEALTRALNIMRPRMGPRAWISLIEETKELLTDSTYVKPLSKTALKIIKRIKDAENGITVSGNVFDDLTASFQEAGFSNEESVNRAWKAMGVYSSRGSSMEWLAMDYMMSAENMPALIPFFVISAGMTYLDTLSSSTDQNYSFPPNVKTSCKTGKQYHFWNAAYISRRLAQEGHGAKVSALAMHLSGLFYDIFSDTWGRDPYQIYRVSHFSTHNNSLRVDVLFHSLGGAYAAKKSATFFDGDRNFGVFLNSGKALKKPKTEEEITEIRSSTLKHFSLWNEIMAPDSSFYDLW